MRGASRVHPSPAASPLYLRTTRSKLETAGRENKGVSDVGEAEAPQNGGGTACSAGWRLAGGGCGGESAPAMTATAITASTEPPASTDSSRFFREGDTAGRRRPGRVRAKEKSGRRASAESTRRAAIRPAPCQPAPQRTSLRRARLAERRRQRDGGRGQLRSALLRRLAERRGFPLSVPVGPEAGRGAAHAYAPGHHGLDLGRTHDQRAARRLQRRSLRWKNRERAISQLFPAARAPLEARNGKPAARPHESRARCAAPARGACDRGAARREAMPP